jgi:two-component system CheB/CheR fusion protein
MDPCHHSMLTEIIAKATKMPVREVKSGDRIKPNRVYVIPHNALMAIRANAFTLTPRGKLPREHLTINFFMRSLAENRGNKAIGIVLSGTGGDGTLGLESIKAEGGLTFAQTPDSAKYDGMPRSAIDSGWVDFVLPPKDIANELSRIHSHSCVCLDPEPSKTELASPRLEAFSTILERLRTTSGVDFSQYKPNTIHRRALRRMIILKLVSLSDYAEYLKSHPDEGQKLDRAGSTRPRRPVVLIEHRALPDAGRQN